MIVRILGEGQRSVDDGDLEGLNALDSDLIAAVDSGDADGFSRALSALLDKVRQVGKPLPDDEIVPSDLCFPPLTPPSTRCASSSATKALSQVDDDGYPLRLPLPH